jgi:hypothetical protein
MPVRRRMAGLAAAAVAAAGFLALAPALPSSAAVVPATSIEQGSCAAKTSWAEVVFPSAAARCYGYAGTFYGSGKGQKKPVQPLLWSLAVREFCVGNNAGKVQWTEESDGRGAVHTTGFSPGAKPIFAGKRGYEVFIDTVTITKWSGTAHHC